MITQAGAFKEDRVAWTPEDFRFTCQGDTVYAFRMKEADGGAAIKSLGLSSGVKVAGVRLLGVEGGLSFDQQEGALTVDLPDQRPAPCVPCLAVKLA
jgi:alpha-L-fucosidase